ncbi:DUF3072 domain-containing protein [Patulibacter sp. SYSU D01012]|uniref:DUF3072 domain-containing protein n=1 Tax=Patulibacter sp. SYSU D01012 TaxID=2817381 RepID=UPI001B303D49|nr:DUF3072 domain-containing protein [Patulibacter sp. SYSU D01012]
MTQSTPDAQDPTGAPGPEQGPTDQAPQRTPEKDPDQWATGGEPATGPQLSYVSTLAQEAGVEVPENLTKADASKLIDELQDKTGRGGQPAGG